MNSESDRTRCGLLERVSEHALGALQAEEAHLMRTHISGCSQCRAELDSLDSFTASFAYWPTDVLRPPTSLWARLSTRIAANADGEPPPTPRRWLEPEWEQVADGISCKILATDSERGVVSMLVRLAPGAEYPPHRHAGVEELHLLDGELWIDEKKLHPGDYNRAEPGSADRRVWSETGCTCVLTTSIHDELR